MSAPKQKHAPTPAITRPAPAEREAAEDRADVEDYLQAKAEWEADGRRTVSHDEVKRRLGLK